MNWNRPKHKLNDSIKREAIKPTSDQFTNDPIMTFGKYKGFKLTTIPSSYLEWLITVTPDDNKALGYAEILAQRPDYVKKLRKG
jgi:hypothetical protein